MPKLSLTFSHSLPPDDVVARMKTFAETLRASHADSLRDVHELWEGNRARFEGAVMGFSASGEIEVDEREVRLTLAYPFFAAPFRGRIEAMIRETAESLLQ